MSRPNLKLAEGPSPRKALAEAIATRDAATDRLNRLREASHRAEDLMYGTDGPVHAAEHAEEKLAEAKASESKHLVAVATGEAKGDEDPVEAAKAVLQKAQSRVATGRRTRDAIAAETTEAEHDLEAAQAEVNDACRAVLASECAGVIDDLLKEGEAVQQLLVEKVSLLAWMKNHAFKSWPPSEVPAPIREFLSVGIPWSDGHPACRPWAAALAALRKDAAAALPT